MTEPTETVDLVGVRANGEHVNLGKVAKPPRMKAREIAQSYFGPFQDDDGSESDACFGALEELIDWLVKQGWTPPQPTQAQAAVASPLTKLQRKAIAVCFTSDKVSVSEVQRQLSISYADAQTLCQSIVDLGLTDELELAPSLKRGAPASQPAPVAQGDALTDTYVQQVPDKCDRIVWRGRYYHLPIDAAEHSYTEPSPMAKVAAALRQKAEQEDAAYQARRSDQGLMESEWGPMEDAPPHEDPPMHVAVVEGDDAVRTLQWNRDVAAFAYPVGTLLYAASAPAPSGHIKEPYTVAEIKAKIASNDYSAELLLQHAMLHLDRLAASAGSEPVAWQYRSVRDKGLWFDCTEERAKQRAAHPETWDVRYLYTHPSPPEGMVAAQALRKVLSVVQRYLPPDGPTAHDAMTEITEIVDPWPLGPLEKP